MDISHLLMRIFGSAGTAPQPSPSPGPKPPAMQPPQAAATPASSSRAFYFDENGQKVYVDQREDEAEKIRRAMILHALSKGVNPEFLPVGPLK